MSLLLVSRRRRVIRCESLNIKTQADTLATSSLPESHFMRLVGSGRILEGHMMWNSPITAHDANYGVVTINLYTPNGALVGTVFARTTQTTGAGGGGNITVAPWSLGTPANAAYQHGYYLTFAQSKSPTGVALPGGKIAITTQS